VGRWLGVSTEKIEALNDYAKSPLFDDDTIAELTMIIAWENSSSRFNRAFRIPSQGFWKP
jgi:alkylhydroperoxidase family enzyme